MKFIKRIFYLLFNKNKIVEIRLGTCYTLHDNNITDLPDWLINDVKDQIYRKIIDDVKLSKIILKHSYLTAKFDVRVPIGLNVEIFRIFYYDSETLYSSKEDSKSLNRSNKISQILNEGN